MREWRRHPITNHFGIVHVNDSSSKTADGPTSRCMVQQLGYRWKNFNGEPVNVCPFLPLDEAVASSVVNIIASGSGK